MSNSYEELGRRVGALVDVKNQAYGSAFDDAGAFLRLLYPAGIAPDQYGDALALVRIFDKMKRIATDRDALGESPYQDIAGYGLLGLKRVEAVRPPTPEEVQANMKKVLDFLPLLYPANVIPGGELPLESSSHSFDANGAPVDHT